jgi:uncharacterized membrane protein (DUF4010 family)
VLLASAAGGLVSSTAVTAANARRAAAGEGSPPLLAAGTAIATAISFLRVVAIVLALQPSLLVLLAPPLIAAALVAGAYGVATAYWRDDGGEHEAVKFRNPFGFWAVVGFAVLLSAIIMAGRAMSETFGASGAIVGAAALGLADVDAVTVSMARLVPQPLSPAGAAFAILAAVASNTLSKLALGVAVARGRFAVEIAAMTAGCLVAGALAMAASFAIAG